MTEVNYGSFKQAAHFHAGRIAPKRLIVMHATAGLESASGLGAEAVQKMFADPNGRVASAHIICDQNSIARSVHDADTAFGAAGANSCGLHCEQVGMADQDRAHWLDPISKATIGNAARVTRDWANLYGIDKRVLSVDEVRQIINDPTGTHLSGFTTHLVVQQAHPSTGHTDPGVEYPMDYLMSLVHAVPAGHTVPARVVRHNPYHKPDFNHNLIKRGERGEPVKWTQWALGITDDGIFGKDTFNALEALQRKYHLKPVDGIVGHDTGARLATLVH